MMHRGQQTLFVICFTLVSIPVLSAIAVSQDTAQAPQVDYSIIKPIIEKRCSTCHNENDEEGGLNLDDTDRLLEYVTAGKPEESGLYQSLTGANDLSQMPPEEDNEGNPLESCPPSEMALIYLWIQQGASLEGVQPKENDNEAEPKSAAQRIFLFTGYFHPAIVHFPIALITMSALFIVLFFRNEALSDDAAYYLLFFGTLSSIVACIFGWAFADRNPVTISDFSLGINRHRWFGIGATVVALVATILGWRARSEVSSNRSGLWKFGVIITAALMGIVGHQGGEEVYGEGVYERAAQKLIPEFWPFGKETDPSDKPGTENEGKPGENPNSDASGKSNTEAGSPSDDNESEKSEADKSESKNSDDQKTKDGDNLGSGSPPSDPTIKNDAP